MKAIDTEAGRITIKYDAVEPLNWPAGAQPFPVAKPRLRVSDVPESENKTTRSA